MDMEAVMYSRNGCKDCETMQEFLSEFGVRTQVRLVDSDAGARSEWESLDGRVMPVVVIRHAGVVHGLDCTRAEQLMGWIGC